MVTDGHQHALASAQATRGNSSALMTVVCIQCQVCFDTWPKAIFFYILCLFSNNIFEKFDKMGWWGVWQSKERKKLRKVFLVMEGFLGYCNSCTNCTS